MIMIRWRFDKNFLGNLLLTTSSSAKQKLFMMMLPIEIWVLIQAQEEA